MSRSGESLHPGFEPLLDALGLGQDLLAAGFPRHDGHWVRTGDEACYVRYGSDEDGPWQGFQAGRSDLDAMLLGRAEELGVTLHRPWSGAAPVVEDGRVVGVSGTDGMIHARFVVDAAGGRHWLARRRSLPIRYHSPPVIARFGYARGTCPGLEAAPVFTAEPKGWSWAARVGEGLYAWTALVLKAGGRVGPPELIKDLTPLGKERRADVTWRCPGLVGSATSSWATRRECSTRLPLTVSCVRSRQASRPAISSLVRSGRRYPSQRPPASTTSGWPAGSATTSKL